MRGVSLILMALAVSGCNSTKADNNQNGTSASSATAPAQLPSSTAQAKKLGLRTLQCQMDQCNWLVENSRDSIRKSDAGELIRVVYNLGTSDHAAGDYEKDTSIAWSPAVVTSYSFCSKSLPSQIYQLGEKWQPVVFNFPDFIFGFQQSAANLYMSVCHDVGYDEWDNKEVATRFGYGAPPNGAEELSFANPVEIFDVADSIGKFSFAALKDDDTSPGAGCYGQNKNGVGIVSVQWGGHMVMRPNGILTAFYAPGNDAMGASFFTAKDGSTVRIIEGNVNDTGEESVTRNATLVYESGETVERETISYSCGA